MKVSLAALSFLLLLSCAPGPQPSNSVFRLLNADSSAESGAELSRYYLEVRDIIESNWRPPIEPYLRDMNGVVVVSFVIGAAGDVSDIQILQSCHIREFDDAAIRAVSDSSPLPALPASFSTPPLSARFRFYYNVTPEEAH